MVVVSVVVTLAVDLVAVAGMFGAAVGFDSVCGTTESVTPIRAMMSQSRD